MNGLFPKKLPTFNFLTLGRRGVGKTVFLAGCYAEINEAFFRERKEQALWFEPQNPQDKEHLDNLLNYVAKTGQYPPATLKITEFNLDVKKRDRRGIKTLSHFRWYDIPGEYCDLNHPEYQKLVLNSQSCCIFINAAHLVNVPAYRASLNSLLEQVISIASLQRKAMKQNYAFALIFTQCDLLPDQSRCYLQIEEIIQPLIMALETEGIKHLQFYTEVPIIKAKNHYQLDPKGAGVVLHWLVSELQKTSQKASLLHPALTSAQNYRRWLVPTGIIGAVLASAVGLAMQFSHVAPWTPNPEAQIGQSKSVINRDPDDFQTLVSLAELYVTQGQYQEAIPLMEKITQQKPNSLDWQLNLAKLYEFTQDKTKAEGVYDRILAQDNQHFYALWGKAVLRQEVNDSQTAQRLFKQAEQVAPTEELKTQIRQVFGN